MDINLFWKKGGIYLTKNEDYFCLLGARLIVLDRLHNVVCTFSDMRNYSCAEFFEGHFLVARNTGCTYKVYDIRTKTCKETYRAYHRDHIPHTRSVIDQLNHILYDIYCNEKTRKSQVVCLDLTSKQFKYIDIPYTGTYAAAMFDNRIGYQFIRYELIRANGDAFAYPEIINFEQGRFIRKPFATQMPCGVMCFSNQLVVFRDGQVLNLQSGVAKKLEFQNTEKLEFPNTKRLSVCTAALYESSNMLVVAHRTGFNIFDLEAFSCIFSHIGERYVSDARIIGNDLFMVTWEKYMWVEDFVNKVSQLEQKNGK